MPGTFAIDGQATFAAALVMSSGPKLQFQSTAQEVSAQGIPKWTIEAAVTFHSAQPGMKAVSEVISITIAAPADPAQGVPPGTPITFDGFRVGVTPPEKNDRGGIRGGKLWYQATGLRPAAGPRAVKSDAA